MKTYLNILTGILVATTLIYTSCKSEDKKQEKEETVQGDAKQQVQETNMEEGDEDYSILNRSNPHYKTQHQVIKGYVKDGGGANVILDELGIGEINPLISVVIKEDHSFIIEAEVPEPGIYQLRFPNGTIHLFLRGGEVSVKTDISDLGNYEIIGSPESYHLREMYQILSEMNHKTNALQNRVKELEESKKNNQKLLELVDSLPIYYQEITLEKSEKLKNFIERIDTSMVALLAAFYMDPDLNYEYLMTVRDKFSDIAPHSRFYKQFNNKISSIIPVHQGHEAPEIVLEDYNGKDQSLSSLKGNYVLVYFWASYSNPCRAENEKLREVYNKYKDQPLKIYAISIDEEKAPWTKAIAEDDIEDWIHVSSLLGWEDAVANIYQIEGIPYMVMVDKEGIIKERGIRAHELESILAELF